MKRYFVTRLNTNNEFAIELEEQILNIVYKGERISFHFSLENDTLKMESDTTLLSEISLVAVEAIFSHYPNLEVI
ncbi:MAG: hypothetical protein K2Q18_18220, partial [Bdellovibrionales bacterium]|nr:hypothetical protein [Bdellovibrionales bacterium]